MRGYFHHVVRIVLKFIQSVPKMAHYGVKQITVKVRKMLKKNLLDLFADLAVFESGT
jgi:hypothetical protein